MRVPCLMGLALLVAVSTASAQEATVWTSGPYEGVFRAVNKAPTGEASFICKDGRFSATYTVSLQDLPPSLEGGLTAGVGFDTDGKNAPLLVRNLELVGYVSGAVTFGGQRAIDWAKATAGATTNIDFFLLDGADQQSNLSSYGTEGAADAIAAVLKECKIA